MTTNTFDVEKIKKYCQQKRHDVNKKIGDYYGYEMKEPYTKDEVDKWNIKLPADLYTYLTEISREIFFYSYPYVFTPYMYYSESDEVDETDPKDIQNAELGRKMAKIGEGGCTFSNGINTETGEVYYLCGDDDYMFLNGLKIANSFTDYVNDKISPKIYAYTYNWNAYSNGLSNLRYSS